MIDKIVEKAVTDAQNEGVGRESYKKFGERIKKVATTEELMSVGRVNHAEIKEKLKKYAEFEKTTCSVCGLYIKYKEKK